MARVPAGVRVVHCRRLPYDVYVGRPSKWGNPFIMGIDGSRDEVVDKYEAWIRTQPALLVAARLELRGKVLGCWCAPRRCHGDVLALLSGSVGPTVNPPELSRYEKVPH